MKPEVLIYRSDLLPVSETFIAAQAGALRRYEPVFSGLRRAPNSLPLASSQIVLARAAGERLLYQQTGFAPALVAAARARHPALIHAHFAPDGAEALPLARLLRIPLVVTLHGYDVMCADETHRAHRRGRLFLARRERLWREAALFICVSDAIRERAATRGFPRAKLRTLPIGVDTTALRFGEALAPEPNVLFVGRLVEKKGCFLLLRAMEIVQQTLPAARLIVAGDGPERQTLEAAAARHTWGTEFLGVQTPEQVRAWMHTARCLIAPSITARNGDAEGLPTVLCEALALGLPVASTVHSGIPELIAHEAHGLLSPEGDAEALARHILALCTDDALALRLKQGGRERVEHHFNLQKQTALLEHIYDELADRGYRGAPISALVPTLAASVDLLAEESPYLGCKDTWSADSQTLQNEAAQKGETAPGHPAGANRGAPERLRHQAAWLLSGNGAAVALQALYFLLMGRMLGAGEYGAFVGVVALINVLSQFSSLGMEMVLLRTIARDRTAFSATWARALVIAGTGFLFLFASASAYGHFFLSPALRELLPWLAVSDALFGKVTQLSSRALQGAGLARWSAKLLALANAARAGAAALLYFSSARSHVHISALTWARVYCIASLPVAMIAFWAVTWKLGRPRRQPIHRAHLLEGLSFSFSSSAISVYNDIDKTLLVSAGLQQQAGFYGAAYRVVDVLSTPIVSLFAAASPKLFREGAEGGAPAAEKGARALLRWTVPFGFIAAPFLYICAPALPRLFGHSFAGSVSALRFLCLLPLLRGLHYAWGTAVTASASQWLRTGAQAGVAALNLALNLLLIPRWGWEGAATASLFCDGLLALATFLILKVLVARSPAIGTVVREPVLECAR